MKFSVLGSGSGGNSTFVEVAGRGLLIDAGFGPRDLKRRLALIGRGIEDIDCVLLTHEHHDHVRGLASLTRKLALTVIATPGTLRAAGRHLHAQTETVEIRSGGRLALAGVELESLPLVHDAAEPAGWILEAADRRLGYLTDFGSVPASLAARLDTVDALVMESNHDVGMLREGPYPWSLKRRVLAPHGHLSNDDFARFVRETQLARLTSLTLVDLSETNNRPELALACARSALEGRLEPSQLRCAMQDRPLPLAAVDRLGSPRAPRRLLARAGKPVQMSFAY